MENRIGKLALCAGAVVLLCSQLALLVNNLMLKHSISRERQVCLQTNSHCLQTIADMVENSGRIAADGMLEVFDSIDATAIMVCRVSEFDCSECVDYAIGKMCESVRDEGIGLPVLLLGDYMNQSSLKVLKSRIGIDDSVFCSILGRMDIPIDSHGSPYYFVLYRNGAMEGFFTPDRMDHELTDMYFAKLKHRLDELSVM